MKSAPVLRGSPPRPTVAVVVDASQAFGRGVLRGIAGWMQRHEPWTVLVAEPELDERLPGWLERGKIDGVISRLDCRRLPTPLRRIGMPIVRLASVDPTVERPGVYSDEAAIGRLAADHLVDQGFRNLAFCGLDTSWSRLRQQGFEDRGRTRGCRVDILDRPGHPDVLAPPTEHAALTAWVASLPPFVGIMAATDLRAVHVLDACRDAGIDVPERAAVVGVDDDDVVCSLAHPALTSISQNLERIGYLAADMLAAALTRRSAPQDRVFVAPRGVVMRASTDTLLTADPDLREVLAVIRARACTGIDIDELADATALTRRTLERRFQKELGRSIHEEILRVRIGVACRLLAETDSKLQKIAVEAGFADVASFCHAFKRITGERPGDFRRGCRPWLDAAAETAGKRPARRRSRAS
jgi:LacI family transcriptional regulator